MPQIVVYGDIGGHLEPLVESLKKYGVDYAFGRFVVPDDTCIIQVGDLIDRGPDSNDLVFAVNNTLYGGENWIQLFGNHEANWIGGPSFEGFGKYTTEETRNVLKNWRKEKLAHMAVGITSGDDSERDVLVTHAGLAQTKHDMMGSPGLATTIRKLNDENRTRAFSAGVMLGGYGKEKNPVGVAWAECVSELYYPWGLFSRQETPPFDQIHGHSSPYSWFKGEVKRNFEVMGEELAKVNVDVSMNADTKKRLATVSIGKTSFYAIDQGLGKDPWFDLEPIVFNGTIIL